MKVNLTLPKSKPKKAKLPVLKGVGNKSKLTTEKVNEIRDRWNAGYGESQTSLANAFGINQSTISMIVNNRIWKDASLNNLEVKYADQANTIGGLKTKNVHLEKRVNGLEKKVNELEEQIQVLETENEQFRERITELENLNAAT